MSDNDLEVTHGECPWCGEDLTFDADQCLECGWDSEEEDGLY